jgi:3-isopropylmalate dehydrogenase
MSEEHKVAVIKGDLNGITVTDATLKIVENMGHLLNKPINHTNCDYNADYFNEKNIKELGEEELNHLKTFDQIFLGAIGDPVKIKPGVLEIGILLKLRQAFNQYVNLRPVVLPEGIESVLKGKTSEDINFEICRENSEGLYVDAGWVEKKGTEDEAGYQIMKCTYKGVKQLFDYAVDRAKARKKGEKPLVHFVFKTNVLVNAGVPWQRVFEENQGRDDVEVRYMHIDNFLMQILLNPKQFDVVITENMFGDIATDAGAILQGGIGSAVSGNINPTKELPSMFEPIHGTAPDKWYDIDEKGNYIAGTKNQDLIKTVKPEAAMLSYAMMLEEMGEEKAGAALKEAALENIRLNDYKEKTIDELVENAINFVKSYGGN